MKTTSSGDRLRLIGLALVVLSASSHAIEVRSRVHAYGTATAVSEMLSSFHELAVPSADRLGQPESASNYGSLYASHASGAGGSHALMRTTADHHAALDLLASFADDMSTRAGPELRARFASGLPRSEHDNEFWSREGSSDAFDDHLDNFLQEEFWGEPDPCGCKTSGARIGAYDPDAWGDQCRDWDGSGYKWCYVNNAAKCSKYPTHVSRNHPSAHWRKCGLGVWASATADDAVETARNTRDAVVETVNDVADRTGEFVDNRIDDVKDAYDTAANWVDDRVGGLIGADQLREALEAVTTLKNRLVGGDGGLSLVDVVLAVLFGLFNGFMMGLGDMLRDDFRRIGTDEVCQQHLGEIKEAFLSGMSRPFKILAGAVSRRVRNGQSATEYIGEHIRGAVDDLQKLVVAVWNLITKCEPLGKILGMLFFVLALALICTLILWALPGAGWIAYVVGVVMTLIFGAPFLWKTIKKLAEGVQTVIGSPSNRQAWINVIEGVCEVIGFIAAALLATGATKLFTVAGRSQVAAAFGRNALATRFRMTFTPRARFDFEKFASITGATSGGKPAANAAQQMDELVKTKPPNAEAIAGAGTGTTASAKTAASADEAARLVDDVVHAPKSSTNGATAAADDAANAAATGANNADDAARVASGTVDDVIRYDHTAKRWRSDATGQFAKGPHSQPPRYDPAVNRFRHADGTFAPNPRGWDPRVRRMRNSKTGRFEALPDELAPKSSTNGATGAADDAAAAAAADDAVRSANGAADDVFRYDPTVQRWRSDRTGRFVKNQFDQAPRYDPNVNRFRNPDGTFAPNPRGWDAGVSRMRNSKTGRFEALPDEMAPRTVTGTETAMKARMANPATIMGNADDLARAPEIINSADDIARVARGQPPSWAGKPPGGIVQGKGSKIFWDKQHKCWRNGPGSRDPLTGADLSGMKVTAKFDKHAGADVPIVDLCKVARAFCKGPQPSICKAAPTACGNGNGVVPKGVTGTARQRMPQISENGGEQKLLTYLSDLSGRKVTMAEAKMPASQMTATQAEINMAKTRAIGDLVAKGKLKPDPTVVSRDGYIIDGHHRWSAYKWAQQNGYKGDVPVKVIDMDAADILKAAQRLIGEGGKSTKPEIITFAGMLQLDAKAYSKADRNRFIKEASQRLAAKGLTLHKDDLASMFDAHFA